MNTRRTQRGPDIEERLEDFLEPPVGGAPSGSALTPARAEELRQRVELVLRLQQALRLLGEHERRVLREATRRR